MALSTNRVELGPVFLSHSSLDKPFVRRLNSRLQREGFKTWLDEKDLVIGDSLATEVSKAVTRAKAVIVVVSAASVASNWVRQELTQAAHRMINGQCRLVPIVIDDVETPPELTGLLYADCRAGRKGGLSRVIAALDEEAALAHASSATVESADFLVRLRGISRLKDEVFDGSGFASGMSPTRSLDWDFVYLNIGGEEFEIVVENVPDYGRGPSRLTVGDWDDWIRFVRDDVGQQWGLLISERAPSRDLRERLDRAQPAVLVESLPGWAPGSGGAIVLVTLNKGIGERTAKTRLERARNVLRAMIIGETGH